MHLWLTSVVLPCVAFQVPHKPPPQRLRATGDDGYDLMGSLMRQGPVPFLMRVFYEDKYETSVTMYQLKKGCSRTEAMSNIDAYLEDPNSWMLQKLSEEKGGYTRDYTKVNTKPHEMLLTACWATMVLGAAIKIYYVGW